MRVLALLLAAAVPGPAAIAIQDVTVIDVAAAAIHPHMTVVINGDRIQAIGKLTPRGARVVNGTGKFLIPGLWDMHVHTFFGTWVPGGREVTLPFFVANGITGVRDM